MRTEEGNEKQNLQKNYDDIYKKLIEYEKDKKTMNLPHRTPIHDGCLYDMTMNEENFILRSSKEEDSDE